MPSVCPHLTTVWSFFRNDFNPLWNSEVVQPFLLFSCCPQLWHWLSASQGAHLYMSTEIIGRKSITGTKQSWVHTYYLHVHWIMEIPLLDSVADKSSDLSLDTHWPENDLLWYFHNRWCRLFGHEKKSAIGGLPKSLIFCEKYHSKKFHNPMPIPSASSKKFLTTFNIFWMWSNIFDHAQICKSIR